MPHHRIAPPEHHLLLGRVVAGALVACAFEVEGDLGRHLPAQPCAPRARAAIREAEPGVGRRRSEPERTGESVADLGVQPGRVGGARREGARHRLVVVVGVLHRRDRHRLRRVPVRQLLVLDGAARRWQPRESGTQTHTLIVNGN